MGKGYCIHIQIATRATVSEMGKVRGFTSSGEKLSRCPSVEWMFCVSAVCVVDGESSISTFTRRRLRLNLKKILDSVIH